MLRKKFTEAYQPKKANEIGSKFAMNETEH